MAKIFIFRGPTGCGKTYQAFNRLNSKKSASDGLTEYQLLDKEENILCSRTE